MEKHTKSEQSLHIAVIVLLALNVLLSIGIYFKGDATSLEELKVGGKENFKLVKQIYNSPAFQAQQKAQIEQALTQIQAAPIAAPTAPEAMTGK